MRTHPRTRPPAHPLTIAWLFALGALLSGCVAVGSAPLGEPPPASAGIDGLVSGQVVRVVDGDTAHIVIDGVREKVRFIGIDTPESTREVEPYGKAASNHTKDLIDGRTVWLETDAELRDRYGRLLAYVWLDAPADRSDGEVRSKMLNARLLLDGYAQIYTFPPNVRYAGSFVAYQQEARRSGTGLWSVPGAADPLTGRRAE
jgi:micrococcal nuclease